MTVDLSLERIQDAERIIRARLPPSPLLALGQRVTAHGQPVLLKAESLQPTGSFKVRGALNKISHLSRDERAAGVVAYSTGNHAQAVAWAAREAAVHATIVMSPDVPAMKVDATRALGADVVMAESTSDARRARAETLAVELGAALVPPYDDLDVIAGQSTIVGELLHQTAEQPPTAVYVPIGGGGLVAGVATATALLHPVTRVIGVEPELEADAWKSFRTGHRERLPGPSASIADAIRVQQLGDLTWPLIQRHVDDIVTVTEKQIAQACRLAANLAHLLIEPAGAVSIAAALQHEGQAGGPVIALACGGNIDLARLSALVNAVDGG